MNRKELREVNRQLLLRERREERVFPVRKDRERTGLEKSIEEKIPEKAREALDRAFYLAFQTLFLQGTGLLDKTFNGRKLEQDHAVQDFMLRYQGKNERAHVRGFHLRGVRSAVMTTAVATVEGTALGLFGIGLPDIAILMGILLRGVYQMALRYGFRYDSKQEQYYILLLLQSALSSPAKRPGCAARCDAAGRAIDSGEPFRMDLEEEMKRTAKLLSDSMLLLKFLQGTAVVGAVGGVCNFSASRRVMQVANLKYQKRFLEKKRRKLTGRWGNDL